MKRILFIVLFMIGLSVQVCLGQTEDEKKKFVPQKTCGDHNFETDNYVVNKSRIDNPYSFLPWVKKLVDDTEKEISALVDQKPFTYSTAVTQALDIIEKDNKFFPDSTETRVRFIVEVVSVESCSGKSLDLVYGIYSSQILGALTSTIEARQVEKKSPQTTAGFESVNTPAYKPVKFVPLFGYDSTNKFSAGGRLEIAPRKFRNFVFNTINVEGQASSKFKNFDAGLSGSYDSEGWLRRSDWRLDYSYQSLPTEIGNIKSSKLSAQLSGITKSLMKDSFTLRFGGLIEGGNKQTSIINLPLATDTVANTSFGALKFYAGVDSRLRHNIFSASYGLQLGAAGKTPKIDWVKHIVDVKHEFWYQLGNHRILDLESQFTAGFIQVPGKIPLSEKFFGGANEKLFIPNDDWKIRENPVIRAIPGSRFYRTFNGIGANSFFSYNFTAAYAVWRKPLVPKEITSEPGFKKAIDFALNSAGDDVVYTVADKNFIEAYNSLSSYRDVLRNDFDMALTRAMNAHPGEFSVQFNNCREALDKSIGTINDGTATGAKPEQKFQAVRFSMNLGFKDLIRKCVTNINAVLLNDPSFTEAGNKLKPVQDKIQSKFDQIDNDAINLKIEQDTAFTRNTLNTLLYDTNLYSIGPVFVFDVARISAPGTGFGGTRYGPGAGLRLELVNSVNFTAGYAWNVRQLSGEGRGNLFFSLGLRDFFSLK